MTRKLRNIQPNTAHLVLVIFLAALVGFNAGPAYSQTAVIRAVLFYSPTCPHCHEVMENVLPPLVKQFPGQLDIVGVDVSHSIGQALYQGFLVQYKISDDRVGVWLDLDQGVLCNQRSCGLPRSHR